MDSMAQMAWTVTAWQGNMANESINPLLTCHEERLDFGDESYACRAEPHLAFFFRSRGSRRRLSSLLPFLRFECRLPDFGGDACEPQGGFGAAGLLRMGRALLIPVPAGPPLPIRLPRAGIPSASGRRQA